MMAGIKGKNTKPEIAIRKALFALGLRYRIHDKRLPGKPDLVFPDERPSSLSRGASGTSTTATFKMPSSVQDFWQAKIEGNRQRDVRVRSELQALGWRHLTVWECALKGKRDCHFPRSWTGSERGSNQPSRRGNRGDTGWR